MVDKFLVPIPAWGMDRMIRVYLPKSYGQGDKRYPVLYLHDGQNVFQDEDAHGGVSLSLEDYFDTHSVEMIVVGIDMIPGERRIDEFYAWKHGEFSKLILGEDCELGGLGGEYIDFIVDELKPLIDRKYRTLDDSTAMAGISSGAHISVYAACRYPQIFRRVAGFSSAFYRNQEGIEEFVRQSDLSPIEKLHLDCGTKEGKGDEEISRIFLNSNKAVYELLQQKVPHATFQAVEDGEHHYLHFRKRVPAVLASMFQPVIC